MDVNSRTVKKLDFRTLFLIYLRSFFFQGSFSVKNRQNIGFAFCLEPAGRKLWNGTDDRRAFHIRHSEFFNGNPFMITLILGVVANMEERLLSEDSITADDISRFKTAVGKASGSVGDRFFWRSLRPFGLVLGLFWTMFYGLWGVLLFLAIFNIPTMILKWYWLTYGYRLGDEVVTKLNIRRIDRAAQIMERLGALIIAFYTIAFLSGPGYGISWITAGAFLVFVLSILLLSRGKPLSVVFPVSAVAAVIFCTIICWMF